MVLPAVSADVDRRSTADIARIQRRTLSLLVVTQIIGGIGVATGVSVGALLAASMAGTTASGLAGSAAVIGGAVLAIPATRIMRARGRRPGLAFAYVVGACGSVVVVLAAHAGLVPLMFAGMFLFGGASTANLQARYAAIDLAEPDRRARHLSLVVWVTTVGAIVGPNLAPIANDAGVELGLRDYSGPYLLSAAGLVVAALAISGFMRPDPLVVANARQPRVETAVGGGWRAAARAIRAHRGARLGMSAMAVGHVVMVGVMSMTPVYISGYVHQHGDQLKIVGLVISLHIVGMYALSPFVGWLTDRFGARPVILGGVGVLVGACALAGTAGHSTPRLSVALALIGAGWCGGMVAGSTLLSASVPAEQRTAAQGLSDVVMGVAGASAGALSGVITDFFGYPTLALLAALATVPLLALALRPLPARDGTLVQCD